MRTNLAEMGQNEGSGAGNGRFHPQKAWRVLAAAVVLLVLVVGNGCRQRPSTPDDSLHTFTQSLDEEIPRLMRRYDVPGVSIALIEDGALVWSGAYGYADMDQGQPMTVDAICRAESISKSVTAWGVMRLVEQGQIGLDDPVQRYLDDFVLPESVHDAGAVTVRRLLSNSAGLPLGTIGPAVEFAPGNAMPPLPDYLAQEARLIYEPGAQFLYSNVGFNLLELLVEEVTGQDFAAFMAGEVLRPLRMNNASFAWNETLHPLIPNGYELDGTPVPPYVYPVHASGGLFANVEDIAHFVSAGMKTGSSSAQAVLQADSVRLLYTSQVETSGIFSVVADAYGFGHFIETLPDGRTAVWHGGQGHGWMTHFHAVPESGDGIVILTNSQRSWPFIAQALQAWSRWNGFGPVQFSRIIYAATALQLLVGLVLLAAMWQVIRLVWELRRGTRRLGPLASESRARRILQAVVAVGVLTALAWSAAQPYLFVTSVFPNSAGWAGIVFLVWAVVTAVAALFPRVEDHHKQPAAISAQCAQFACAKLAERLVDYAEARERAGSEIPEDDYQSFIRPYENKRRLAFKYLYHLGGDKDTNLQKE